MLTIENLAVDHGKLRAIWDLSLQVEKGSRVGLLGANGAGKSTTLGAILGLYPPAEGDIGFKGKSIAGVAPPQNVEAGIALVPEGRRLFGEMTVRENLEMGAYTTASTAPSRCSRFSVRKAATWPARCRVASNRCSRSAAP